MLGINETWLNDKYNDEFEKMPEYHHLPEHKDRTLVVHGGILLYIHKDINYHRRDDLESSRTETIWIEVVIENASNILICTVCL